MKTELLTALHQAQALQQDFVASLTDAEQQEVGTLAHWNAKDTLAHITFWDENLLRRLEAAEHNEPQPDFTDFNEQNDAQYMLRHDYSWERVIAENENILATLLAKAQEYDEEMLTNPERHEWTTGAPLYKRFLGSAYRHALFHFMDFYSKRGAFDRALTMQQRAVEQLSVFGGEERGLMLYNLACLYATSQHPNEALALLPEALQLAPNIKEFAKQDPDLVSLHETPAFQAVVA